MSATITTTGDLPDDAGAPSLPLLSLLDKWLYCAASFTLGAHNAGINTFLFFYLTAVCGLSGTLAGFLVFLSLMVDAVLDPFIGYMSDNLRSRWGRRHPFMAAGLLPWTLAYGFLFGLPEGLDTNVTAILTAGLLIVVRVANSVYMLPYQAMAPEIVRDYHERSAIGGMATFCNIVGSLAAAGIGFGLFFTGEDGLIRREAYLGFGWAVAAIGLTAMLLTYVGTRHLRGRMHEMPAEEREGVTKIFTGIKEVFGNQSFRVLFMVLMLFWSAEGTAIALELYVVRYFWELPMTVIALGPIWVHVGMVTGLLITALLMRRFSKHGITMVSIFVICAVHFLPVPLRLAGLFPTEGPALWILLYSGVVMLFAALVAAIVAFGAMMADATDEHEYLYGSRREGLYYAAVTLSNKAATGIGALVAGLVLDLVRFPSDPEYLASGAAIPWEPARNLALVAGPGAAVIAVTSGLVLLRYRLTAERLAEIQKALRERRGQLSGKPG
jgi:GPH family glycoside/pentoside/hexuronide:cation symporter